MPALHTHDFDAEGFQWIDCNDADQSTVAFIRRDNGQQLVCILNFTPVVRKNYRIGLPMEGRYRELINSDAAIYGGSNCGNAGQIQTETVSWMGFEHSAKLTLPPLGGLLLSWSND
jgi:1,4-alpha-glucan branching enzyme